MARPRPTKLELGNTKIALYNVPQANATALATWSDLTGLKDMRAAANAGKDLVDLAAVAKAQGDVPPSSIEAAALPLLLRGASIDATSLNTSGIVTAAAITALAAVDFADSSIQVLIVGKTDAHLTAIKKGISSLANATKKPVAFAASNAPQGHILLAPAEAVAGLERMPALKLVIVSELHAICTLPNVASVVAMASLPVQVALFGSEVIFSHEDATALKLRDFQSKTVGKGAFAHLMDSKDISDFLEASKLKFSTVLLASTGAYDLSTLRNADTKLLARTLGEPQAVKIASALEALERKSAAAGAVPPFDMYSGQWEWTPDSPETWASKGVDPKFVHTEPDGSRWIFSAATAQNFGGATAASPPWENEDLGDQYGDEYDADADAAWDEMYGSGAAGSMDMSSMVGALPLSDEIAMFAQNLPINPRQRSELVQALQRCNISKVQQVRDMRWTLTMTLGIDYDLAGIISQALDQW